MTSIFMRSLDDISVMLRQWPRHVLSDRGTLARDCAEHARQLFAARRAVLAVSEGDEPGLLIAESCTESSGWREEEERGEPLVDPALAAYSFLHQPGQPVRLAPDGAQMSVPTPIPPFLIGDDGESAILSISVDSEESRGRLFVFSPDAEEEAMLKMADVVGTLVSSRLEAAAYSASAVEQAVEEERTRVGRDLHDGLLQSFTGLVLQLETIHSTLESNPEEARRMITAAQALIMADQRDLRRFVEQLRPRTRRRDATFDFGGRLEDLRTRFQTQWGVRIAIDIDRIDPLVGAYLGQETFRLIQEAVTKSAKHGGASEVHVGLRSSGSDMQIEVSDNGSGFPFQGRMTLEQMRESGSGPKALAERVHSLNGHLVVDSTDGGSTVTISVPLGWGGS